MLKEYLSHSMVGTPFEIAALRLRSLLNAARQTRHPELRDIFIESARMRQIIERVVRDEMNCIEVGCHLGSMLQCIKARSPNGRHIGVEPVPYKAAWLKKKFPDLEILQIALSDSKGEAEFFLQSRSSLSGLRIQGENSKIKSRFTVACERLDDIVPRDRHIGFMKLDAEGGELAVLKGGEELLKRCHPVIMFISVIHAIEAFDVSPKDVYEFFVQKHGYSIFLFKDWLENGEPLSCDNYIKAMQYPYQAFRFLAVPAK